MTPDTHSGTNGLSPFLCQELLYDYVTGRLDAMRVAAVESHLAVSRDSARELERLKRGLGYAEEISRVGISPAYAQALTGFEPKWKRRLRAWTLWSSERGWRWMPYIFLVLVLFSGFMAYRTWTPSAQDDVILAEQLNKEPDMVVPEMGPSQPIGTVVAALTSAPTPAQAPLVPTGSASELATPPEVKKPLSANEAEARQDESAQDALAGPGAYKGELKRATMEIADFDNTWPLIRDKIVALGGKVAGSVELGWMRKNGQAYFHFSIPESNREELELFLGTFGPVRFSSERHPRVMPEGQIRIILTVKDNMTNEAPSETP